jgi:2-phospho-L-lactate guanylyltransferase (CobY/MobA/RfbA family)
MSALELTLLYLLAAVLGVVACRSLKLPPMLGYLAVGVVIGPNALALAPGSIPFQYGPDSAHRHLVAARGAGLRSLQLDLPALSFDVDTPDDLARLRTLVAEGRPVGANTAATLRNVAVGRQVET